MPSGRWVVLAVALGIQISTSVIQSALPVLLPFVKAEFHLSFADAGLLANFAWVGGFFTIAAAGWAVDTVGDRIVLVVGGIVAGVAAILCGVAPNLAALLVALLVMGAGISTPTPAGSVAVRSAFPRQLRGMVMGIRQTGVPIGGFLAAVSLPWIAIYAGWRWALAAAGAASIAAALVALAVYRPGPQLSRQHGDSRRLSGVLNRDLTIAAISGLFLVAAQICLLTYLIVYLIQDRGLGVTSAALVLAFVQVIGAAARVSWGAFSDRAMDGRRRPVLILAAAIGAAASLTLAALPTTVPFPLLVVAIAACAACTVGWNGVQISFFSELSSKGREGRAVALGLMIEQPGILVGPYLFGLVVDHTGSFRLAWLLVAGFLVVAALIMTRVRESPLIVSAPPA